MNCLFGGMVGGVGNPRLKSRGFKLGRRRREHYEASETHVFYFSIQERRGFIPFRVWIFFFFTTPHTPTQVLVTHLFKDRNRLDEAVVSPLSNYSSSHMNEVHATKKGVIRHSSG